MPAKTISKARDSSGGCVVKGSRGDGEAHGQYSAETRWFAVWTRSRQEKSAASLLETMDVPHFLPLKSEQRQWSDRRQEVTVPLFRGYFFVRINPLEESRVKVLKTPGVVGLVGNSTGPLPIPDEQVDQIRTVLTSGVEYWTGPFLEEGDRVRVKRGALAGLEGTLLRANSQSRLSVSVDLIQHSVAVSISRDDVERVDG